MDGIEHFPLMDAQTLKTCVGCTQALADQFADPITYAMDMQGINTPKRQAAFLAQIGHESGSLHYTREIWGPTAAQQRYEGRHDLGNVYAGDGHKFLGRGLIQITGRDNYTVCAEALCLDCVNRPELLEEPGWAALSAAWWWNKHGCNTMADAGQFDRITRTINGGMNGSDDRRARWAVAKKVLGV